MTARTVKPAISPDERLRQVAAILAFGVVRHRHAVHFDEDPPAKNPQNLDENGLDLDGETRLSGAQDTRGLRMRGESENG